MPENGTAAALKAPVLLHQYAAFGLHIIRADGKGQLTDLLRRVRINKGFPPAALPRRSPSRAPPGMLALSLSGLSRPKTVHSAAPPRTPCAADRHQLLQKISFAIVRKDRPAKLPRLMRLKLHPLRMQKETATIIALVKDIPLDTVCRKAALRQHHAEVGASRPCAERRSSSPVFRRKCVHDSAFSDRFCCPHSCPAAER